MKREEFMGLFLGVVIQRMPKWLPEESTEEDMLDTMSQRLNEHSTEIRNVLYRNNRCDDKEDLSN